MTALIVLHCDGRNCGREYISDRSDALRARIRARDDEGWTNRESGERGLLEDRLRDYCPDHS